MAPKKTIPAPAVPCKKDLEGRPTQGVGSWRWRRAFLWAVAVFCMWAIAYCLLNNLESRVAETSVLMAFGTLASLAGSYVFGATWDDKNARQQADNVADRPLK